VGTLETLDLFGAIFSRRPVSFTRTPETLAELQMAWTRDGYRLLTQDVIHGESVLVMTKEGMRAAIDMDAERVWGVLP
jgi:hypothetical protein